MLQVSRLIKHVGSFTVRPQWRVSNYMGPSSSTIIITAKPPSPLLCPHSALFLASFSGTTSLLFDIAIKKPADIVMDESIYAPKYASFFGLVEIANDSHYKVYVRS